MMCLAGCVSESEPLPEKDAPEPIVTEGWDNQSHQFKTVNLEDLIDIYPKMLKGETSGRYIVDLNK